MIARYNRLSTTREGAQQASAVFQSKYAERLGLRPPIQNKHRTTKATKPFSRIVLPYKPTWADAGVARLLSDDRDRVALTWKFGYSNLAERLRGMNRRVHKDAARISIFRR